jgi:hypothetical protein
MVGFPYQNYFVGERNYMRKPVIKLFSMMVFGALLLSACSGLISVDQPDPPTPTPEINSSAGGGDTVDSQPDQPEAPSEGESAQNDSQPAEDGEESADTSESAALPPRPALGFENGDSELEATDPNQVDLASGELYLVEMFAFW